MSKNRQLQAWVSGLVQGVGFRWFTQKRAHELGLNGWVRNLADGRVELCAQGPEDQLKQLLQRVWSGPPGSRVRDVAEEWTDIAEPLGRFQITG